MDLVQERPGICGKWIWGTNFHLVQSPMICYPILCSRDFLTFCIYREEDG